MGATGRREWPAGRIAVGGEKPVTPSWFRTLSLDGSEWSAVRILSAESSVGGELLVGGELPVGAFEALHSSESWWWRLVGGEPSAGSMLPSAVSWTDDAIVASHSKTG